MGSSRNYYEVFTADKAIAQSFGLVE